MKIFFITISIMAAGAGTATANSTLFDPQTVNPSPMVGFDNPSEQKGVARLYRDPNGTDFNIVTTGLDPEAAYTVWAVIFNNPSACINASNATLVDGQRCDEGDLSTPAVRAGLLWTTGGQASSDGVGNFDARIPRFDSSVDMPFAGFGLDKPLLDSRRSEIHLIVRRHPRGNGNESELLTQLTTFELACTDCTDIQFSVHPAPTVRKTAGGER